jgi:hypothetical protein
MRKQRKNNANRNHHLIFRIDGDGNVVCSRDVFSTEYVKALGNGANAEQCRQAALTEVVSGKARCG